MTIQKQPHATTSVTIPARIGDSAEINYGEAPAPDFGPLARDKVPVRAMKESDLSGIIAIDRRLTGNDPEQCPPCHRGRLHVIALIPRPSSEPRAP